MMKQTQSAIKFLSIFSISLSISLGVQASEEIHVDRTFSPSGWMGDGMHGERAIDFDPNWRGDPHSPPAAIRIEYRPQAEGWAGIYWLNRANNWGEHRGADFSEENYSRISFWARGETGEEVVEFKAGGIEALGRPFRDSFESSSGRVSLTTDWTQYEIPLEGLDLSNVIGGFAWVAASIENPDPTIFYIDDIRYE